jgi:glycerophosphoryl diester phosphodiesterase
VTGRGPLIRSLCLAELAVFDVGRLRPGSATASQFLDQQPHDGARIPSLADVLSFDPDVRFMIELKTYPDHPARTVPPEAMANAVLAVVDQAGVADRVVIESFDWRGPRHVRRTRPAMKLAWLTSPTTVREAALWWDGPTPNDFGGSVPRAVAAEGGQTWAPHHADLTSAQIEEAHALGLAVLPWTVNAAEDVRRLVAAGVDGLITDRPDIARHALDIMPEPS